MFALWLLLHLQQPSVDLTLEERLGIERALHAINMSAGDLGYDKRPFNDKYRLPVVNQCLDDPLAIPSALDRMKEALVHPDVLNIYWPVAANLEGPEFIFSAPEYMRQLQQWPNALMRPVHHILSRLNYCNDAIPKQVLSGISAKEQRDLLTSLPFLALEDETDARLSFAAKETLERFVTWSLVDKIPSDRFVWLAKTLAEEVRLQISALQDASKTLANWKGHYEIRSPYGRIIVSGVGDDTHVCTDDIILLIDLGGNDTYSGYPARGLMKASVVIDLEGDDTYKLDDLSGGAGLLGIGILHDVAGNDTYRAGHLSLGAGLCGVGILQDDDGDDVYIGKAMTQGFGMFGCGFLTDGKGDDIYNAQLFAQGAARTMGVGVLCDRGGNDTYRAGGWLLNSPLFSDVHYSFAQGFASGYREDTGGKSGGFGMLVDWSGDDAYIGETYCQGASYWFSFGALLDLGGHDTYTAYHYAQASAMHLTVAVLADMGGDDAYVTKWGAAHAIGHDYGVALLMDRAGKDLYVASDSRPGLGNANGVGIFVDSAGDDRYGGPPGFANPARGSGSVGLFVDLSGVDKYQEGPPNGGLTRTGDWAAALDEPDPPAAPTATGTQQADALKPGTAADPGAAEIERLYKDATLWEVGTATETVRSARKKLIEIGVPAARLMVDRHLATMSRLEARAFEEVFSAVKEAQPLLVERLGDSNDQTAANALRLCTDVRILSAAEHLEPLLARQVLVKQTILAAGELGAKSLAPKLVPYVGEAAFALAAVISLQRLALPETVPALVLALRSDTMPVREGAVVALVTIGQPSVAAVLPLLRGQDQRLVRLALEVLRKLKSPEGIAARDLLGHPDWGVRLDAADTVAAIGQKGLIIPADEPDPVVRKRMEELTK